MSLDESIRGSDILRPAPNSHWLTFIALLAYKRCTLKSGKSSLTPLVSLIAGILILIMPRLLNYIVAFYLIVIGLIGLFGGSNFRF